jgi:hypothetical protein
MEAASAASCNRRLNCRVLIGLLEVADARARVRAPRSRSDSLHRRLADRLANGLLFRFGEDLRYRQLEHSCMLPR